MARFFTKSAGDLADGKTRFTGFLVELGTDLIDGIELASNIYPVCRAMESRRHIEEGGYIWLIWATLS